MLYRLRLLMSLCLGASIALSAPVGAEEQGKNFVPGELIVGYNSAGDKKDAVKEFTDPKVARGLEVRGQSGEVQVQSLGETSIKLKIEIPGQVGTRSAIDPADHLQNLQELAKALKDSDSRIKYAHPNWILGLNPPAGKTGFDQKALDNALKQQALPTEVATPNDPIFVRGLHWHYQPLPMGMNAVGAWKETTGSRDVVVAVVDTGILPSHPDIAGSKNLLPGYSFVSGRGEKRKADATDPGDDCAIQETKASWHGTHVAGTIGAVNSNNGLDITGINWAVSVLPVRVLGHCGGSLTDIADAIRWSAGLPIEGAPANDHPADVISMSLGGPQQCTDDQVGFLIDALKAARDKGSVIVVAAGNEAQDVKNTTPGGCEGTISVAASDKTGKLAWYSNFGDVTIMAPGGDTRTNDETGLPPGVWSVVKLDADNPQGVGPMQGTSMATPHVSGAIALALAKHPDWRGKPDVVEAKIKACAVKPAANACPQPCGAGQLDAQKLIDCPQARTN